MSLSATRLRINRCHGNAAGEERPLLFLIGLGVAIIAGCGAAPPAPVSPSAPAPSAAHDGATPAPPPVDPWAVPDGPREDDPIAPEPAALTLGAWKTATSGAGGKGIAPPPASCAQWAKRAPVASDLAGALAETDAQKRDAKLVGYAKAATADKEKVAAFVTALRADLAPVECADAIVDPDLAKTTATGGAIAHVLVGLSLSGKLARTAAAPPTMAATNDKEKVKAFIKGPLATWMVAEAKAIEQLSAGAAGLQGYGQGIAALEAGVADLRLVDKIRSAPTPASWDAELRQVYEAALDEALEPRKRRGRDASLVGLGDFAKEGVIDDPRVKRAREMLSKLYGGRRVDALDGLLLPPVTTAPGPSAFWMNASKDVPVDLGRGYPRSARAKTRADAKSGTPAEARARLDLGRQYWRKVDFVEAAQIGKTNAKEPNDRLVLAVSLALARGAAKNAGDMMGAAAPSQLDLKHTEALDALAHEGGPVAGMAAFDAAHIRSLAPPAEGAAAWYHDVAARFRKASQLLGDAAARQKADARAADAEAAAKAVEGK